MTLRKQIAALLPLVFAAGAAGAQGLKSGPYELPYKNTYVKEVFVAENEFRTAKPETIKPRSFAEARKILPAPVWEGHDKEIEMYWHAWRIAVGNIRQPQEGSEFVSPYLDIAYNGNIFMWDASFMMMFARYGYRFFPFQRSLDNFYAKQHPDGFICREIRADGSDCFERYDPTSTGPNLLPWVELTYYRQFGDIDRLHKVFPALCAYAKWWRLNRTWPDGTYWSSGWGTGMDNMPRVKPEYNPIFSHGHMVWLDTNLQQMLVDESLLNIGFYIERWQEIEDMEDEMKRLRAYVNEHLWDERTAFPVRPLRRRNALHDQGNRRILGFAGRCAGQGAARPHGGASERYDRVRPSAPRAVALGRPSEIQSAGPLLAGRCMARYELHDHRRPLP